MDKTWRPANPVEVALQDALDAGDEQRYVTVLAESVLLVPVRSEAGAGGGTGGAAIGGESGGALVPQLVWAPTDDGRAVIPAYTSPESLARPEAHRVSVHYLPLPFARLGQVWTDPTWVLAVDPGLPVAAQLSGAELAAIVAWVFAPANRAERELSRAGGPGQALAALAAAELHLPVSPAAVVPDPGDPAFPWWRADPQAEAGPVVVPVFTSRQRLRGNLGLAHPDVASVELDLLTLAEYWPDPQWIMAVNPGAPYSVTLPGAQVRAIGERMPEALGALVKLQVLVPTRLIESYLERGYDKAAGVVHLCPAEPVPLAELYQELGLLRPGSPFSVEDQSVHAIRWLPGAERGAQWIRDAGPRTETVELPPGAHLVELRPTGAERLVATYELEHHGWVPAG